MNTIIIINSDDWEGLFVNGKLIEEGHELNDGMSRKKYLQELCRKYNVSLPSIEEGYVTEDYYDDILSERGSYPENLSEVDWYLED